MSAPIATTPSFVSESRAAPRASDAAEGGPFGKVLGSALLEAAGSSEDRQQPGLAALTAVALSLAKPAAAPQASGAKVDLGVDLVLASEWQPDQDPSAAGELNTDLTSATNGSAPDEGVPRPAGPPPAGSARAAAGTDIPLTLEKGLELWVRRIAKGATVAAAPGQGAAAGRTAEAAPDAPSAGSEPLWLGPAAAGDAQASKAPSREGVGSFVRPTIDGGLDAESLIQVMASRVHAVEIAGFSFPMPRELATPVPESVAAVPGADQALPSAGGSGASGPALATAADAALAVRSRIVELESRGSGADSTRRARHGATGAGKPSDSATAGQGATLPIETGRSGGDDANPRRDGRSGDGRDGARPEVGGRHPSPAETPLRDTRPRSTWPTPPRGPWPPPRRSPPATLARRRRRSRPGRCPAWNR